MQLNSRLNVITSVNTNQKETMIKKYATLPKENEA